MTASRVPTREKRRGNYKGLAVDEIGDVRGAAFRAQNAVISKLGKWAALYGGHSAPLYMDKHVDEELRDITKSMAEMSKKLNAYFKKKPMQTRVCFAAFTPKPTPDAKVVIEGVLPEVYKEELHTLLVNLVGGGYKYLGVVDNETKRADKKARVDRYNMN